MERGTVILLKSF